MSTHSRYTNGRLLYFPLSISLSPDCLLCNPCSLKGLRKATYICSLPSFYLVWRLGVFLFLAFYIAEISNPSCLLKSKPTKKHLLSHILSFCDHLILADLVGRDIYIYIYFIFQTFYIQFTWIISWFKIIAKYLINSIFHWHCKHCS